MMRTTLALIALFSGVLAGCGSPQRITSQPGDAWQCGQQLRQDTQADPVLGWLSISSLDRWIAAVDRIGIRSGQFASGSSVRETALTIAEEKMTRMGIENLRWVDMARPIHMLLQADQNNPIFGVSLVLPVRDQSSAKEATRRLHSDFKAKGHDLVLNLRKVTRRGTGRQPVWIRWLDHGTALATLAPQRIARADSLARCVETRQPRELLHVGVAVAELMQRHQKQFKKLQRMLQKLAKRKGGNNPMVTMWYERIQKVLHETDAAMFLASAGEEDVSLGVSIHAKTASSLAKTWSRQSTLGANPLTTMLPGDAWFAMTQSYDAKVSADDIASTLKFYTGALKMPPQQAEVFVARFKEMTQLMGHHSAAAIVRSGRFPLEIYGVLQAEQPGRLLDVMADLVRSSVRVSLQRMIKMEAKPTSKRATTFAKIDAAMAMGWGGMADKLVDMSQKWPVRISRHHAKAAANKHGLTCHTIRVRPDGLLLAKLVLKQPMIAAFLPKKLDFSVCTGAKTVQFAFGPTALRRIGSATAAAEQAASAQGTPTKASLAQAAWFTSASQLNGHTAQFVTAFNPTPLLEIAQKFRSDLPEWPKGNAISAACLYGKRSVRCDLRLPVVIADFVAALRPNP